jgi:hypothetical protein
VTRRVTQALPKRKIGKDRAGLARHRTPCRHPLLPTIKGR